MHPYEKAEITALFRVSGIRVWLTDVRNGDMALNVNMADDGELVGTVIIMAGRPVRAWSLHDMTPRDWSSPTEAIGYLRDAARLVRESRD